MMPTELQTELLDLARAVRTDGALIRSVAGWDTPATVVRFLRGMASALLNEAAELQLLVEKAEEWEQAVRVDEHEAMGR